MDAPSEGGTIEAEHWSEVDIVEWPAPNFPPEELACRGSGRLQVEVDLLLKLETLREELGDRPLNVVSGYRTPAHNRAIGGARRSLHLQGRAADIALVNHDGAAVEAAARRIGFGGIGRYPQRNFIHVDTGRRREWGAARWPEARTRFAGAEPRRRPAGTVARKTGELVGGGSLLAALVELWRRPDRVADAAALLTDTFGWAAPWIGLSLAGSVATVVAVRYGPVIWQWLTTERDL